MHLEAIFRKEERSHHRFFFFTFVSKGEFWFPWHLHPSIQLKMRQLSGKKISVEVLSFQCQAGILHCTLKALTSAVSTEWILILNIKIWFITSLTHAVSKKWRSLHVSFRTAAWQQFHFYLLSCFSFTLFAEQKLKKWLWKNLHCATDVLHRNTQKPTERSGEYTLMLSTKAAAYIKLKA